MIKQDAASLPGRGVFLCDRSGLKPEGCGCAISVGLARGRKAWRYATTIVLPNRSRRFSRISSISVMTSMKVESSATTPI
jgi:hypothetical protein